MSADTFLRLLGDAAVHLAACLPCSAEMLLEQQEVPIGEVLVGIEYEAPSPLPAPPLPPAQPAGLARPPRGLSPDTGLAIGESESGVAPNGDILLFAEIGSVGRCPDPELLRYLLEADHAGVGTGGCTLGVRQETDELWLSGRFPVERLNGERLAALLQAFAEVAAFWQAQLREWAAASCTDGSAAGRLSMPQPLLRMTGGRR